MSSSSSQSASQQQATDRKVLRIGTRRSALALRQTHLVMDMIRASSAAAAQNLDIQVVEIVSQGDKILDVPLSKLSAVAQEGNTAPSTLSKGVFTKELENALLDHSIDFAVHSLKDLPTVLPQGLQLGAISAREDPSDALVLPALPGTSGDSQQQQFHSRITSIEDLKKILPENCRIGTSSLRRKAQLLRVFPKAQITDVRGNLQTRLKKLDDGQYDALVLAAAGLTRLHLDARISFVFPPEAMMHAVGQASLGVECREGDEWVLGLLRDTLHEEEAACFCEAERSLLRDLEGGCSVPLGVTTKRSAENPQQLVLHARVLSLDGTRCIEEVGTSEMTVEGARRVGKEIAERLRAQGAKALLDERPQ